MKVYVDGHLNKKDRETPVSVIAGRVSVMPYQVYSKKEGEEHYKKMKEQRMEAENAETSEKKDN